EDHDYFAAMALQEVLVADDQIGQLWRQETAQTVGPLQLRHLPCHPRLEFGVPFGQLVGLSSDGVVVSLDPRQRRDSRQQLALVEWLGDEVVGPRLEGGQ